MPVTDMAGIGSVATLPHRSTAGNKGHAAGGATRSDSTRASVQTWSVRGVALLVRVVISRNAPRFTWDSTHHHRNGPHAGDDRVVSR